MPATSARGGTLRETTAPAELRALPADSAFAYTIRAGWVEGDADEDVVSQGEILGEGDRAVLRIEGEEIHFLREEGAWRWDMMPAILAASKEFAPDPDDGMTEDEFYETLDAFTNKAIFETDEFGRVVRDE